MQSAIDTWLDETIHHFLFQLEIYSRCGERHDLLIRYPVLPKNVWMSSWSKKLWERPASVTSRPVKLSWYLRTHSIISTSPNPTPDSWRIAFFIDTVIPHNYREYYPCSSVMIWKHVNLMEWYDFTRYAPNDSGFDMSRILVLKLG